MKKEKGITLVALILTIVILLILAVVTINSIQGDGIIAKAMKARKDYEDAAKKEQGMLDQYLGDMEGIPSGTSQGGSESGDDSTNTEGDSLQEENKWAPIVDSEGNNIIGNILSQTENIPVYDELGNKIILPAGFKIIADESTNNACRTTDGIVITDGTNEFVWVPVTNKIETYGIGTTSYREPDVVTDVNNDNDYSNLRIINNILSTNYTSSDDFLADLQADFNAMAESVNKNGGFYVGRYETSLNNGKAQSVYGATSENTNSWYGLYAYEKAAYNSDSYSVQSTMIWGSQYEAMMRWMEDKIKEDNIGEIKNTTRVTGTKDTDIIKNVFDLYGNSCEWTLEALSTSRRIYRGGHYSTGINLHPATRNYNFPWHTDEENSSRLALYIK